MRAEIRQDVLDVDTGWDGAVASAFRQYSTATTGVTTVGGSRALRPRPPGLHADQVDVQAAGVRWRWCDVGVTARAPEHPVSRTARRAREATGAFELPCAGTAAAVFGVACVTPRDARLSRFA